MHVIPIPLLMDNYAYLVIDEPTGNAAVVDPSEASSVIELVRREHVTFVTILNTHHHWDHVGGNEELVREFANLNVCGHERDKNRIPGITQLLRERDTVRVGNLEATVLFIPCHTSGHIAYYLEKEKAVFTGDTLFIAGCGKLSEGTAEDMHRNITKLMALPNDTKIFCGHEYTEKNLRFALTLEPGNPKVREKLRWAQERRARAEPTVPSMVGEEKEINPFVRWCSTELQESLKKKFPDLSLDPISILARTRHLKDSF